MSDPIMESDSVKMWFSWRVDCDNMIETVVGLLTALNHV